MQLLILHCDYFKYEVVEKTSISEDIPVDKRMGKVNESVLVVFVCSERDDEKKPEIIVEKAVNEIEDIVRRVKPRSIVLHSFAHLSSSLANPRFAKEIYDRLYSILYLKGYQVFKTPFGWRDSFELKVKSHPVSKVSRKITS
jgi:threonyl-tRNA synthetase